MGNRREVIIDNDFLQCLTSEDKNTFFFLKVMKELNVQPVVHPYVRKREMFASPYAEELIGTGELKALEYSDFITKANETYYKQMFENIYKEMNGTKVTFRNCDVFTFYKAGCNLGEIHSLLLGLVCDYDVFLSNDQGAKDFAERKISAKSRIQVKDVIDVFEGIAANPNSEITKKEFDCHVFLRGKMAEKKKKLKQRWQYL